MHLNELNASLCLPVYYIDSEVIKRLFPQTYARASAHIVLLGRVPFACVTMFGHLHELTCRVDFPDDMPAREVVNES